jgi:hypothetical protein
VAVVEVVGASEPTGVVVGTDDDVVVAAGCAVLAGDVEVGALDVLAVRELAADEHAATSPHSTNEMMAERLT